MKLPTPWEKLLNPIRLGLPVWLRVHFWLPLLWWLTVLWALLAFPAASAQTAFGSRYTNTAVSGDILLIGNVNYHCTTTVPPASAGQATACTSARSGGSVTNNNTYMLPIDIDADAATSNSSSATLNLPAGSSVLFARLYWNGISTSAANRSGARFAIGGAASSAVTATGTYVTSGSVYQSFVDVTPTVQAAVTANGAGAYSGVYTVGNVASTAGSNSWAGWTLVIAFKNTSLPTRNLAVFDGLQTASSATVPVDIAVSGFITPSLGSVKSVIGVVAYDGDRGSNEGTGAGGSLQFGKDASNLTAVFNTTNPVDDVFNSSITTLGSNVTAGQNPAFTNTLGVDIDTLTPNTPLPNGSTSAVVRVIGTSGDVIYPGIITLATEIFIPNIKDSLTKSVTDLNGGVVVPGDILEYELIVKNSGNDGATNVVLTDPLPANITYLPGSLVITGINAGSKSDGAGDDQAEYTALGNSVTFRLGTGANAAAGGLVLPGEETRARFRATVNAGVAGGTLIDNTGTVNYKQQTLQTAVSDTSDSDPVTAGDQPTRSVVAGPDFTVTKTHTGNAAEGGLVTFTLSVKNAGLAPSFGTVTLADTLPAGLSALSISGPTGGGWTCTLSPLQCTRSDVLAPGASYPDVTLQVRANAGTSGNVTNKGSVSNASEAASAAGNNNASDVLTIQPKPAVTLSKTVRNVSSGGAAGTTVNASPGQTLEYCISFVNTGGDAQNFSVADTAPGNSTALPNAYGAGLAVQLTVGSTITTLTGAADTDAARLIAGQLSYAPGTLALGQSGKVCFQVRVN
jgi:uncharacterized repeat protein (TIGR01451 family)